MKTQNVTRCGFWLAIACSFAFGFGCAAPVIKETPARVVIRVHGPDAFEVEGKRTDTEDLVKAVKKTGAKMDTEIVMLMPADFPRHTLLRPYAALQKEGYKKVFFTTPKEITTEVGRSPAPPKSSLKR